MSVNSKKNLSIVVYYTLAGLALAMTAFFVYCLIVKDVALWAEIIYYIWSGLVVGAIIFDVICTSAGEGKVLSGWIVYILSMLAVGMACLLYFVNTGATGISADFFNLFISVSIVSLMATGYLIATWVVGENLVEHATAENEIASR